LATNQPAAKDLRAVIAVMFIVVEIERIGDHAAGIAKTVILMEDEPLLKTVKKIPKMGEISHQMFLECMVAFVNRDAKLAQEISARDTEMDDLYRSVFDHLIEIMAKRPKTITQANYLSWCAHNLERIADRVTNISERIIFMTTGIVQELDNS
jgi:phosphate transport system protein